MDHNLEFKQVNLLLISDQKKELLKDKEIYLSKGTFKTKTPLKPGNMYHTINKEILETTTNQHLRSIKR